jgi:predicted Zn-dependent peptidase
MTCHKTVLANGLTLISVPMPHLHSTEMVCYVGVGSRHETPANAGVSHFLEHMLFRGTENFPTSLDVERAFEAIGGAVNAATDAESTCYHSRVRADFLPRAAEQFADLLRRPRWNDLETEKRIILEEALEDLNEKGEIINPDQLTNQLLWPDHPLSQPIIGDESSLQGMNLESLTRHHQHFYTPRNTVIAVTGQVEHAAALAAVEQAFADWEGVAPEPPLAVAGPVSVTPKTCWVKDSSSQMSVQLAWRVPGRESSSALVLRTWRRILSWGGTSRLMLRLREELGLTYNVEANLALYQECGCLSVDLAIHPDNLLAGVSEVLGIFSNLRRELVTSEELERAKLNFRYDMEYSLDHTDEMAIRYGWGELVGYRRSVEQDLAEMEGVSAEQLMASARELFVPENLKAAVVGPWSKSLRDKVDRLISNWPG